MYINEVIVTPIMTQTRLSKPKKIKFRSNLGFNQVSKLWVDLGINWWLDILVVNSMII